MPKARHQDQVDRYTYTVVWSEEDEAFVARVAEFPSLATHGGKSSDALREIQEVVRVVIEDLKESEEPVPAPLNQQRYSGKLNLRMPSYLHQRLAIEAAQQGVSLNHYITLKLEGASLLVLEEQAPYHKTKKKNHDLGQ